MGATATLYRIVISSDPLAFLIVRDYGCRGFALVLWVEVEILTVGGILAESPNITRHLDRNPAISINPRTAHLLQLLGWVGYGPRCL